MISIFKPETFFFVCSAETASTVLLNNTIKPVCFVGFFFSKTEIPVALENCPLQIQGPYQRQQVASSSARVQCLYCLFPPSDQKENGKSGVEGKEFLSTLNLDQWSMESLYKMVKCTEYQGEGILLNQFLMVGTILHECHMCLMIIITISFSFPWSHICVVFALVGLGFICSLFYPILHRTPHRDMIFVN